MVSVVKSQGNGWGNICVVFPPFTKRTWNDPPMRGDKVIHHNLNFQNAIDHEMEMTIKEMNTYVRRY